MKSTHASTVWRITIPALLILAAVLLLSGCQPAAASQPATSQPAASAPAEKPASRPAVPPTLAAAPQNQPVAAGASQTANALTYPIVDTGQSRCYDNAAAINCPAAGAAFAGQDAQYTGNLPRYQDNGDGTISDLVTGLTWQKDPGEKKTYAQAVAGASALKLGGYSDWRLPTIKELYSLILFDGSDGSVCMPGGPCSATPFVDTRAFDFQYGNTKAGERIIDDQYWSGTEYGATTMNSNATVFGVNFADGRIKGYPRDAGPRGEPFTEFVRYVRGNPAYGANQFHANGDGTITDQATDLTWMQADSGHGMDWQAALAYCETQTAAGFDDWRLPNAKELQSIVDYSRSPAANGSAASDPLFSITPITDEGGETDYPFYWSSTTHADSSGSGKFAAYLAFGKALGYMTQPGGSAQLMDVHGAGAQRSDPKRGDPAKYPQGHGPQGDVVRIDNYARCVRGGQARLNLQGSVTTPRPALSFEADTNLPGQGEAGAPGGQSGPGRQPPQAALAACSQQSQGAACLFNAPRGSLSGTCQMIQQQLACVPAGGPPAGPGQL